MYVSSVKIRIVDPFASRYAKLFRIMADRIGSLFEFAHYLQPNYDDTEKGYTIHLSSFIPRSIMISWLLILDNDQYMFGYLPGWSLTANCKSILITG